jgi:lysozyme
MTAPAIVTDSQGIDVSHYQPKINWEKVALTADFAFVKATESTGQTDKSFAGHWRDAKAAGLLRGAYHFFHGNQDGKTQAAHFLSVMGTLEDTDLPPVLDLEHAKKGEKASTLSKEVSAWIQDVEAATKRKPLIYVSPGFWNEHMAARTDSFPYGNYPLWIAHYGVRKPSLPRDNTWNDWTFWQFSGSGTHAGVNGTVDLDKFNGTVLGLWLFLGMSDGMFADPSRMLASFPHWLSRLLEHEAKQLEALAAAPAKKPNPKTYIVKAGDTIGTIAGKFHVRTQDIARANGLPNLNALRIGQVIKLPPRTQ